MMVLRGKRQLREPPGWIARVLVRRRTFGLQLPVTDKAY